MGIGGISWIQLLIILVIVLLIFGTKKLKTFGTDLGGAIKGFKKAVKEEGSDAEMIEGEDERERDGEEGEDVVEVKDDIDDVITADETATAKSESVEAEEVRKES